MKKKLIALAVAGAFAAPAVALAQGSTVTIYGTLNESFGQFSATGATAAGGLQSTVPGIAVGLDQPSRQGISSQSSNIGFKGSEDLGGGLKAGFQIESAVLLDGGGTALGTRNTGVTLSGNFGTVLLGQWDTPYKSSSIPFGSFYSTSAASYNSIIGSPGYGTASASVAGPAAAAALAAPTVSGVATGPAADALFDRRQANSLQYWSPNWSGFSFQLLYSANEAKTNTATGVAMDPRIYGLSGTYSNGPFYVAYAYERHNDFFGSRLMDGSALPAAPGQSSQDTGNKLNLAYTFGNTQVGLIYERLSYNRSGPVVATVLSNYDRNAYVLNVNHKVGAGTIMFNYGNASDASCQRLDAVACVGNGTGAKMYALGYDHAMSKRTNLYATYVRVDNKTDARYTFGTQQTSGVAAPAAGADPQALFAGIRHTF